MSTKLTKSERQLYVQHVLSMSELDLTNNEIINCLNDVYEGVTGQSKLKGDLQGLRSNPSSNVKMIENDGRFSHKYIGTLDYLDPISDKSIINISNIPKKNSKEESQEITSNTFEDKNSDVAEEKKSDIIEVKTDNELKEDIKPSYEYQEIRNLIAKCLIGSKKKLTGTKVSSNINKDNDLVQDELNVMSQQGFAQATYVSSFSENVYGSTKTTESCIEEITQNKDIVEKPENESVKVVASKEEVAQEKPAKKAEKVHISKITENIKDSILLLLNSDGVNGGKGKNALVNLIYDALKGTGIPRHDIEDVINDFIESGDLIEFNRDGRGIKYISSHAILDKKNDEPAVNKDSSLKSNDDKAESKENESTAKEIPENEVKHQEHDVEVSTSDNEDVSMDFDIEALISKIKPTEEVKTALHELEAKFKKVQEENNKWKKLVTSFFGEIKKEFN
jgi:hypothetical protein